MNETVLLFLTNKSRLKNCLPILQATPEQISMDLKNELMYQLEQDHNLQAVSLKYLDTMPRGSEHCSYG